jgi:hypothetical protein
LTDRLPNPHKLPDTSPKLAFTATLAGEKVRGALITQATAADTDEVALRARLKKCGYTHIRITNVAEQKRRAA